MKRRQSALVALFTIAFTMMALWSTATMAQPDPTPFRCGSDLTTAEATSYLEFLQTFQPAPPLSSLLPTYCIPIAAHIVRTTTGNGGIALSQYNQSIDDTNLLFQGTDIVFYTLSIDYIDNDQYATTEGAEINQLRQINVVPNAINVYFVPSLPGLCGISSFTFSAVQGIVMANACSGTVSFPSVLAHEIGHYFDLFHTHETALGAELVNGSNCGGAGDLLCDTPADPGLGSFNVNGVCAYYGSSTDSNGDTYVPDPRQIMSYTPAVCGDTFSPLSQTRAVSTLLNSRPGLIALGCPDNAPTINTIAPSTAFVDQTKDIILTGINLGPFTGIKFGPGVTVNSADTTGGDTLIVNITVDVDAPTTVRDVIAQHILEPDTVVAAFEVLATPSHYVSPTGGNIHPYAQPSDAALALSDAVMAAAASDTVKVDSTTAINVNFILQEPITIEGGYADNFTTRPTRTVLNLSGNLLINATTGMVTIDGFVIQNGSGSFDISPTTGNFGGGIRAFGTTMVVSNCELRYNDANTGVGFGGGGAIFAHGSDVTISGCDIHDNDATYGAGVYLYDCTGTITNSTFTSNVIATGGTTDPRGAAIALEECNGVTMADNIFDSNLGANQGGALWALNSNGISFSGDSFANHSASNSGGTAFVSRSGVTFDTCTFANSTATIFGGGLTCEDSSTVTISDCVLNGTSGILGGAIYASNTNMTITHNLFSANTGTSGGGAMYLSGAYSSTALGNTIDANNSGIGAALAMFNSTVDVTNNLVTNSTGDGISCSSGSVTLVYNLVWNSSGSDYSGCSAGTGSVSADPLYVNAGGGDYHLALNSPAIDTGDPTPAYDDPDGSRGDMGRYGSHVYTMSHPEYAKNVVSSNSGGDVILSWDPNPEGNIDYYAIHCDSISGFAPSSANLVATSADTTENMGAPADTVYYVVSAVDTDGRAGGYSAEVASVPSIGSSADRPVTLTTRLDQNAPNPFNPSTTIRFAIESPARVTLTIYDVAGRVVTTLVDRELSANVYIENWNGRNTAGEQVASGVYFYRLQAGNFASTRKMVLLK